MSIVILTSVLVPAGSADLTDLATLKDELSIGTGDTTMDTWLGRAISQVSAAIANYCNRSFQVQTIQDQIYPARDAYPYQVPGGVGPLQLTGWPLLAPPVVRPTTADTPSGAVLPFASTAGITLGQPVGHAAVPDATVVSAIVANASVTLSQPITTDIPAGSMVGFGLTVRVTNPPGVETRLLAGQDFQIDAPSGQLIRLNQYTSYPTLWDPVLTTVVYQAGYAVIPDDLIDATLRAITSRFQARGRDALLKAQEQPGLGRQEYWIGTPPGVRGSFTEEIADLLDNYRVPVTA